MKKILLIIGFVITFFVSGISLFSIRFSESDIAVYLAYVATAIHGQYTYWMVGKWKEPN